MTTSEKRFDGLRLLIAGAAFFIIIAGLREAQGVLIPILFAMFLAILGNAPLSWLKKRGTPTSLAVLVVAAFIFILVFGIISFFSSSVDQLRQAMPRYQERFVELKEELADFLDERGLQSFREQFIGSGALLTKELEHITEDVELFDEAYEPITVGSPNGASALESLSPQAILVGLRGAVGGLVGAVSGVMLVTILLIFMLVEAAHFRKKLQSALDQSVDFSQLEQVAHDVQRYLAIKTITSAMTGLMVGGFAGILGLDFAVLWGLTAFILNFIPFIGSIIAAIPAVILALLVDGPGFALSIAAGYLVINIGVSNFLEPIFLGTRLGISPLVVFLSLLFWGWIWGPSGMLLSVPLTMLLKIILEHSDEFQWIATLMGGKARIQEIEPSEESS